MTYTHQQDRRKVDIGAALILGCITALSCVSSFLIFRAGFADLPAIAQNSIGLICVAGIEGCFAWLLFGYRRAFASHVERLIALFGIAFIIGVMLINITTHFMMAKRVPLTDFQQDWIDFGGVFAIVAVMLIVLAISLANPVVRLVRLEMRYHGRQQETILRAKTDALRSERILQAMASRAEFEADELAQLIEGVSRKSIGFGPKKTGGELD